MTKKVRNTLRPPPLPPQTHPRACDVHTPSTNHIEIDKSNRHPPARILREGGRGGQPRAGGRLRPQEEAVPRPHLHGQRARPGDGQHGARRQGEALLRPLRGDRLYLGGKRSDTKTVIEEGGSGHWGPRWLLGWLLIEAVES